jgi:hypothetical protein
VETCKDDLKPCIFYLPIFPIGHNVRLVRLLTRWIAEGYTRGISSHTEEKNIEMLLAELWEFSMLQVQRSSKPVKCHYMNTSTHDRWKIILFFHWRDHAAWGHNVQGDSTSR